MRAKLRLDSTVLAEPAPVDPASKVHVVVMPFEVDEATGNRGQFESVFLAASLADTLALSPWVEEAFVSPVPSDAVEVLVEGKVTYSSSSGVDVTLSATSGDQQLFEQDYGIRVASGDFDGRKSPLRKLWNRPTNQLGRVLQESTGTDDSLATRIGRYLDEPSLKPSEQTIALFSKASAIEHEKLLGPITQMVDLQVNELETPYATWRADSLRAEAKVARLRKEAEESRKAAEKIKRSAKRTAVAGFGLTLLKGFANAKAGRQVNAFEIQADMQPFLDAAEDREQRAKATLAEAKNLTRQAEATFASKAAFADILEGNMKDLTVSLEDQVYTLVGAVDAQISQLRNIIRELAQKELQAMQTLAGSPAEAASTGSEPTVETSEAVATATPDTAAVQVARQ